ncbi:MAG: hypothetical protein PHS34_09690 [Candidatus Omnitrophica bacterium]|nr:hypothetical protein [Candidatus Omnitrophota bacterium]
MSSDDFNKIFGIGAHRTGTQSLNDALNFLGFPSMHYNHNFNIIMSLISDGRRNDALKECEILVAFQGFTDIIIPCIYEKLDYTFPNSKYILTIRDDFSWINSVKNHTGGEWFGLFEYMFYGFWKYDERKCMDRFSEHNNQVIEYFKNRPDDLLIFDLRDENKWEKLCGFLNVPVPEIDYPHRNKSVEVNNANK